MSAAIDERIWGAPADGVTSLERELARQRRARTAHAREGQMLARASVLNLVVFADREVHARRAARRAHDRRTLVPPPVAGDRPVDRPQASAGGGRGGRHHDAPSDAL
jgi:hypothetical protein